VQVLVHIDHTAAGHYDALTTRVTGVVTGALKHVGDRITRVEVHLGDENGAKGGVDDKRCVMEAHVTGRHAVAATHHAGTIDLAVRGAAESLARLIDKELGRATRSRRGTATKIGSPVEREIVDEG